MANKKINQLVSKTAILSTDLFGIGDATTGQLFKKTIAELQAAIGGAVISVNGLVGTVVLDTDDIQELASPTNKYFTDARARGAISLTVTGNSGASTYSSGTGVLNVPTYTLAGLGGITASFLSGTSGISYNSTTGVISYSGTVYTDASIRALFSGGTGITYNSSTGAISYSGTVYTDSSVRALISLTTTGTSGASTYNNTTGVINVPNYTLAGLGGISLTSLSGGTGITYNSSTGAISYSGTVYTDASVRALISASGSVSYNNTTGVISLTSGNLTEATSSVLTITGGTGAVLGSGTSIQVNQASTSVSGFLSSTDWNTFNGKANALSGTTNYHAKFTSSTAIGNSLIFDNGTNLGIATSGGTYASTTLLLRATSATSTNYAFIVEDNATNEIFSIQNSGALTIKNAGTTRLTITSTGAATFSDNITLSSGKSIGFGGNTIAAAVNALIYSDTNYIVMNSKAGSALYLNYDNTNASSVIDMFNGKMVVKQTGNVGIGVTPATGVALDIRNNSTTTLADFRNANSSGYGIYVAAGSTSSQYVQRWANYNNDTLMTINGIGNVGILASSPVVALQVGTGTASSIPSWTKIMSTDSTQTGVGAVIDNKSIYFYNSGSLLKIDAYNYSTGTGLTFALGGNGGNILVGTTSDNGERLYVSGAIRATGTITANSDITLKKNLLKIENALEKVEQINGYTYELKEDDSKRHAGVIAQEIQTVLPEIVNKGNDGILGVEYGNISALLIEAIKEQQTQINELKALLNK